MRAVFDTNVLIDAFRDDFSVPAKLLDAVCDGELTALVTPATEREYRRILRRLWQERAIEQRVLDFMAAAEFVPSGQAAAQLDDAEDYKFIQAAVGGGADVLVTSDHHLLDVGAVDGVRIVTPQEAWVQFEEETGGTQEWQEWASGLGLGAP